MGEHYENNQFEAITKKEALTRSELFKVISFFIVVCSIFAVMSTTILADTRLNIKECYIVDAGNKYMVSQPLYDYLEIDFDKVDHIETQGNWNYVLFTRNKGFLPIADMYAVNGNLVNQVFLQLDETMPDTDTLTVVYKNGSTEYVNLTLDKKDKQIILKKGVNRL